MSAPFDLQRRRGRTMRVSNEDESGPLGQALHIVQSEPETAQCVQSDLRTRVAISDVKASRRRFEHESFRWGLGKVVAQSLMKVVRLDVVAADEEDDALLGVFAAAAA